MAFRFSRDSSRYQQIDRTNCFGLTVLSPRTEDNFRKSQDIVVLLRVLSDWGRLSQAAPIQISDHTVPRVTRFSSRSARGRRMMGSGRQSVSICFTTLRGCLRFGTLNEITLPIVPTGTIRLAFSGRTRFLCVISPIVHHQAAARSVCFPKRNSEPSHHIRCRITASLRATATRARAIPRRFAMAMPQARRLDHFFERTSSEWAAS